MVRKAVAKLITVPAMKIKPAPPPSIVDTKVWPERTPIVANKKIRPICRKVKFAL